MPRILMSFGTPSQTTQAPLSIPSASSKSVEKYSEKVNFTGLVEGTITFYW